MDQKSELRTLGVVNMVYDWLVITIAVSLFIMNELHTDGE